MCRRKQLRSLKTVKYRRYLCRAMGAEDGVRKFLICVACLFALKITESWVLSPMVEDSTEHKVAKVKEPVVSHPR